MPGVYLETFGCQMNELDSELVVGRLRALGYAMVARPEEADAILYNTCSVREHAEQKVWSRLGELAAWKRKDPGLVVGVLGCLAERDGLDLIRRMPVVDVMCGPGELDRLPTLLDNAIRTNLARRAEDAGRAGEIRSAREVALQGNTSRRSSTLAAAEDTLELLDLSRAVSPGDHAGSAYVRITRGCNKFCTYCVVPYTRGAEVHRPPDHIVEECKRLASAGVAEVTLLGQTVNHYRFEHDEAEARGAVARPQKGRVVAPGLASGGDGHARVTTFASLLRRIHDEVPSIARLRFVTSYPRDFGDDILRTMRDCPRICRYLHVPAQSGSNRVLRAMNRGYTVEEYEEFLARARAILDEPEKGRPLMVSGDFIVGFPGETEEDFERTRGLLERSRLKNAFVFKYSPRPGTTAFERLEDDVPDEVKRRRNNDLLAAQSRISDEISRAQVGREFDVLVEGLSRMEAKKKARVALTVGGRESADRGVPAEAGAVQLSARTDADQIVFIEARGSDAARASTLIGKIIRVRIDRADRLSLHARVVEGRA